MYGPAVNFVSPAGIKMSEGAFWFNFVYFRCWILVPWIKSNSCVLDVLAINNRSPLVLEVSLKS